MANHPHQGANLPILNQRVVRGDALIRLTQAAVSFAPDLPTFSWPGVMDELDESPPWVMEAAATWTQCVVGFGVVAAIEFDIKVNGSVIESIVCSTGSPQTFAIDVPVERDDEITLELTDFDTGAAEDVSVKLRYEFAGS
jgi:hypothetical protein